MLAVNISYLAIPGLESSSFGQIASLSSIIASVGCIVIGSLLASEHYTAPKKGWNVSSQVIEPLGHVKKLIIVRHITIFVT